MTAALTDSGHARCDMGCFLRRRVSLAPLMLNDGDKESERIDLGLGTILSGAATEQVTEVTLTSSHEAQSASWSLGVDEQTPPKSDYEQLADDRKWSDLVKLAESRFAGGSDCEPKLWWIRAHLGAFSMPVSYLAAPLESLCRAIVGQDLVGSVTSLLRETGLLALSRLREVGDFEQTKSLREALALVGVTEPKGPEARMRKNTSSFRTLEIPALESAVVSPETPVPSTARAARPRRVLFTALTAGLVAMLFIFETPVSSMFTQPLHIASESFVHDGSPLEQSVAPLSRRDPGGRLGALFYSIGESSQAVQQEVPRPQVVVESSPPVSPAVGTSPVRERVDTAGPIEGREFRNRVDRQYPPVEREPTEPQATFEDRSQDELRGGPPQAVLPHSGSSPTSGSMFRVLARTSVVSAPSFGGRVIGVLEAGDRVLVEGRVGRWLKLRSKKGRGGYVPAEDVEETPEFDSQNQGR